MLFHSFEFLSLLFLTCLIYYLLPKQRLYLLAIANLVFYGVSGISYLLLFLAMSIITYYCSRRVNKKGGRIFLYAGVLINLFNLAFFKYTGFVLKNFEALLNLHFPWQDALLARIILPVGISFYTFQLIAYLVDVFRKDIKPCRSLVEFWVFISFFAQLIAGPIMRGSEFLPQIEGIKKIKFDQQRLKYGLYYICMGLSKKLIFSDQLAPRVQYYFSLGTQLGTLDSWFATYLFAFQIYFDFSSYSEIAVGIGHLFGFDLAINFKTPYLSSNASEFWKRWHITLSSWIRDYVYIPMGGSKRGFKRQCLFLVLAMTLSGLWHGAAWGFIVWGIYHGLLSLIHKLYAKWVKKANPKFVNTFIYKAITVFMFFQFTTIGWVFFRANSLRDAASMVWKMVSFTQINYHPIYIVYFAIVLGLWLLHLAEYYLRKNASIVIEKWHRYFPEYIRAAAYVMVLIILILFTQREQSTFIYFQF